LLGARSLWPGEKQATLGRRLPGLGNATSP
jgi:hypothetical protein